MTLTAIEIIQFSNFVCDHIITHGTIPLSVEIGEHDLEYNDVWELCESMGLDRLPLMIS